MAARSKRAEKIRTAGEFDLVKLAAELRSPKVSSGYYAWDLDRIRLARDAQMLGNFQSPARLSEATRTDYAIFASLLNRLAPQLGLPVELKPPSDTARANRVLDEATALFGPKGVGITTDTLTDIDAMLANHGVAFATNVVTPRPDGSRVDFELKAWPIEFVRWDASKRSFLTATDHGIEYICHGDGRWVVFQQHEIEPWKYGAVLPLALLWADHAFGVRDRSKAGTTHGNAALMGELPQGIALQNTDGTLTHEARAMIEMLKIIMTGESPVGVRPAGSKTDLLVNNSTAWQIFKEIIESGDKAADRIYLGHDDSSSSSGGDGVKYLFGVRNDIVEGSLRAIERGLREGTIEPWAAVNFSTSELAPSREYLMPDADEDDRRKSLGERYTAFYAAIEQAKKSFELTQGYVDALAKDFGVTAPMLKALTPTSTVEGNPQGSTAPASPGSEPLLRAVQ